MNPVGPWADYFVGMAGASAALTGLILLAQTMIYALIGLIPTRTAGAVAWALALTALIVAGCLGRIIASTVWRTLARDTAERIARTGLILGASLAVAAGALGLAAGWSGGLYLVVAGSLASVAIGLVIAWVLLMAVRRLKTDQTSTGRTLPASTESPGGSNAGTQGS